MVLQDLIWKVSGFLVAQIGSACRPSTPGLAQVPVTWLRPLTGSHQWPKVHWGLPWSTPAREVCGHPPIQVDWMVLFCWVVKIRLIFIWGNGVWNRLETRKMVVNCFVKTFQISLCTQYVVHRILVLKVSSRGHIPWSTRHWESRRWRRHVQGFHATSNQLLQSFWVNLTIIH